MTVSDFMIPAERDHLLAARPGIYSVKNVFKINELENLLHDAKSHLQSKGPSFILDHFDEFFSVLLHGSNVKLQIWILAFERIHKCLDMFVAELETAFDRNREPSSDDKPRLATITKMLAYLLGSLTKHIENAMFNDITVLQTKQKKNSDKSTLEIKWQDLTDKILILIYQWISLPLEKLWTPPTIDKTLVPTIANICYKILERCKAAKDKSIRESIFQNLGVLVKKYNYGISFVLKIVQLVKLCDGLGQHLGAGIAQLIEETQCTGMMKEIMREVNKMTSEEGASRNISNFLEKIGSTKPELMLPVLHTLIEWLDSECYIIRQCAIVILGTVVRDVLTSENLSEDHKTKRNQCLDSLMEQIFDVNITARSRTLQTWQSLCSEGAVPITYQTTLLETAIGRLKDKNPMVRKQSFLLLRTMLQCNPFASQLDHEQIGRELAAANDKLKALKCRVASLSEPGSKAREEIWRRLLPKVQQTIANACQETRPERNGTEPMELDTNFETVRQLLFLEKFEEALELLTRTNAQLPQVGDLDGMDTDSREEYLMCCIHKVFMDSQEALGANGEQGDGDSQDRNELNREMKKREEEYNTQEAAVTYLKNCSLFADALAKAIPLSVCRLQSATPSDAIEACTFLGLAYQFKVKGAKEAVRQALRQGVYPNPSVCENLAEVYRDVFIGDDERYKSDRQKALSVVQTLIGIFKSLGHGESPALAKLIVTWREQGLLEREVLQVMWERFSQKLPDTSPLDSRAALALLTMAAEAKHSILKENLEVLLAVGLGPRSETDLLLARDTCRALMKIRVRDSDPLICPSRLPFDSEIFQKITSLLIKNLPDIRESAYPSFAVAAINAIYHLADKPESLMEQVLISVHGLFSTGQGTKRKKSVHPIVLANLFTVVGHIAVRQLVHYDVAVYTELKRESSLMEIAESKKKGKHHPNASVFNNTANETAKDIGYETPSSASRRRCTRQNSTSVEDSGEEALEGAAAEDVAAEFIRNVLENEIVTGNGMLAKFAPLIKDVCQHPERFTNESLQIAATLALCKMMTVSSIFCRDHLQLLITILERSPIAYTKVTILVGLSDLMIRFPNEIEPWTQHIYGRLRDDAPEVRRACIKMLSNLIMREMIRVKGQVSELAVCLVDPEDDIREEVTRFFIELAKKGNSLYNIIPDILSRLTDPGLNLEEDSFREIIKYILGLVQKQKQIDSMVERICVRLKLATSDRQCRDLTFCLSLLKYNAKGIHRLSDNLNLLKDKVHFAPLLKVLQDIIDHGKKKPEMKTACTELEEKLDKLLTSSAKDVEMPPPASCTKVKKARRRA